MYGTDEGCLECGAARPDHGWDSLKFGGDPWLGTKIGGRYLTTRRIGVGASGRVYRAESLSISRQFAVKIIDLSEKDGSLDAKSLEERLSREIAVLGTLRNPHIVSFYDAVRIEEKNSVALVMDLIDGQTLQELGEDRPLDLERGARVIRQVANGLHEAHEAGMIHRDIKPDNIMIERLPAGDDFVHILDFGVVRREGDMHVTQGFLGTPLYASPEQIVGDGSDRRGDIYSLGAVWFFVLTGRPPFLGDHVYEVLKKHIKMTPPRPNDLRAGQDIPGFLEDVVLSMLAKKPEDRPDDLTKVIDTVDRYLSMQSGTFEPPTTGVTQTHRTQDFPAEQPWPFNTNELEPPDVDLDEAGSKDAGPRAVSGASEGKGNESNAPEAAILKPRTRQERDVGNELETEVPDSSELDDLRRDSGLFSVPSIVREQEIALGTSPGGERFAFIDATGTVYLGSRSTSFDAKKQPLNATCEATSMCLAGDHVIIGTADGLLFAMDMDRGEREVLFDDPGVGAITSADCELGGRLLIMGTQQGCVYYRDERRGEESLRRTLVGETVESVAISAKRASFAVARSDGSLKVHRLDDTCAIISAVDDVSDVEQMAFSNDAYLLAVLHTGKRLSLFQVDTGRQIMAIDEMVEQPLAICFDEDEKIFAYCEVEDGVYGWDLHHHLEPAATP